MPGEVDADIRHEINFVLTPNETAAMGLVVEAVMEVGEVETRLCLYRPVPTQRPRIASEGAETKEVTLHAVMAGITEHAEVVEMDIGEVIMDPPCVVTIVPTRPRHRGVVDPVAGTECQIEMSVFAGTLLVTRPRTVTERQGIRPCRVGACFKLEIRGHRSSIDKVRTQGKMFLCPST